MYVRAISQAEPFLLKEPFEERRTKSKTKKHHKESIKKLYVERRQKIGDEHTQLISEFLSSHNVGADTSFIFERIPKYISSAQTAWVFSARDKQRRLFMRQ